MNLTNRPGGIDVLWANLKRQSFQDFQLVIVDALWRNREKEVKEYINDPRLKYIRQNDKPENCCTNLAHADNQGFAACEGELIVCLQDYIWINPNALESYWNIYQEHPRALVTGVGHQYAKPSKEDIADPQGKITIFKEPYTRRPEQISWTDPRVGGATFRPAQPVEWELNFASLPRSVIYELGGMDEKYDEYGFAWDNTNIATRAAMIGCPIFLDQSNECMGFDHDGWWPNPLKVERKSPGAYHMDQMQKMMRGEIPVRYSYL